MPPRRPGTITRNGVSAAATGGFRGAQRRHGTAGTVKSGGGAA